MHPVFGWMDVEPQMVHGFRVVIVDDESDPRCPLPGHIKVDHMRGCLYLRTTEWNRTIAAMGEPRVVH